MIGPYLFSLSFLICKMGIIARLTSQGCSEDQHSFWYVIRALYMLTYSYFLFVFTLTCLITGMKCSLHICELILKDYITNT